MSLLHDFVEKKHCIFVEEAEDWRDAASDQREQAVRAVADNVESHVKRLQEPDDHAREQDDRKRALEKVLCLLPEQQEHVLG